MLSGFSHPRSRDVHGHNNADQFLTAAATGGGDTDYTNTISSRPGVRQVRRRPDTHRVARDVYRRRYGHGARCPYDFVRPQWTSDPRRTSSQADIRHALCQSERRFETTTCAQPQCTRRDALQMLAICGRPYPHMTSRALMSISTRYARRKSRSKKRNAGWTYHFPPSMATISISS